MAAARAPSVHEALHDGVSTDGAAAAPTAVRARQRGHPQMALQQRPQPSERDSEAIRGWLCMSAQMLQRPIILYDGWGTANLRVRPDSGRRSHGRLDVSINVPI